MFTMPVLIFAMLLPAELVCLRLGNSPRIASEPRDGRRRELTSVSAKVAIAGIASAAPLMLYSFSSGRFLLEIVPMFAILAVVGIWESYKNRMDTHYQLMFLRAMILVAVVSSVVTSFLLALSGADSRFDDANPELYRFLVEFFGG